MGGVQCLAATTPVSEIQGCQPLAHWALLLCVSVWSEAAYGLILTSFIMSTHNPSQSPFPPEARIWLLPYFSINMILKSHHNAAIKKTFITQGGILAKVVHKLEVWLIPCQIKHLTGVVLCLGY